MERAVTPRESTFSLQDSFAPLPVPNLDQTLQKYFTSAKVFLNDSELERTKKLIEKFTNEQGPILHRHLKEKAANSRNWLSQWWEDGAYLEGRYPSYPLVNFGGASPDYDHFPPVEDGSAQAERAGLIIYHLCRYWNKLRKEEIPIMKNRGTPWCMNQVHRLFNACKRPGLHKDALIHHFKTESEGPCPSHIVVLCRGRFWNVETQDEAGNLFTPPQLRETFRLIRKEAAKSSGSYLNSLTCWDRINWYKASEHLMSLSKQNKENLNLIESAIMILSLTDESPSNDSELGRCAIAGDSRMQFADKSMVYGFHKNGLLTTCNDHANMDAIVSMALSTWLDAEIAKDGYRWRGSPDSANYSVPKELKFTVDNVVKDSVRQAMESSDRMCSDLVVEVVHYNKYANEFFRSKKVYGDTVVQLAMQLAYFRLHSKFPPTYETSSTRKFFHGRTETVRSCTQESVEWCRSVFDNRVTVKQQVQNFMGAMAAHNRLMGEATEANGCDRHLFGLRRMAKELGMPDPDIFTDPTWKKSGGDGNFVLSTSFIGYSNVFGGVAPMCLDGYGCFYKMEKNRITFFVSTWKSSRETNCHLYIENLWWALDQVCKTLNYMDLSVSAKL